MIFPMIRILLLTLLFVFSAPDIQAEETGELILPPRINLSLVHHHYMEPEQFGIMMKLPDAVTGCFDVSGLEYETTFIEKNFMDIKVNGYRRTPVHAKDGVRNCDTRNKIISNMVVVSANDLKARGIRQVRFKRDRIEDTYNIHYSENGISFSPERATVFQAADNLTFNYIGGGLVALHVPMAGKDDDVAQAVYSLAIKKSLTPVGPEIKKSSKHNVFFFTDNSGQTVGLLGESPYIDLGTVSVMRPYNGPQGAQMAPTPLKVFATRPETTL